MAISLRFIEDNLDDYDQPIFQIFKATLQYPADVQLKSTKLAEDFKFVCEAHNPAYPEHGSGNDMFYSWLLLIQISQAIPPDHPWQDCLVRAIDILRQLEGTVPGAVSNAARAVLSFTLSCTFPLEANEIQRNLIR
jgi:hypothetical protein